MKLYCAAEVPADARETHELICRESRLAAVVRLIVWSGVFITPAILGWQYGYHWVLGIGTLVFMIIFPALLRDVAGQFRETNWVLRIDSTGVWINLISYRDKVSEGVSVVWLDYSEIASVGWHAESYSTPSQMAGTGPNSQGSISGDTIWRDVFLEIRLSHDQTGDLQAALNHLRSQAASDKRPAAQSLFRSQHFPVWLLEPAVLRVTWTSSHRVVIAPRILKVLARLETYVRLAEPTQGKRPNWNKLAVEDRLQLARELVHVHGAYSEAVTLLVRSGDMSYSDATTLVQRFEDEGIQFI
ncbi:MAG: hypothetical protein JWM11_1880 [Planctomycetaceae bacterium]|nr:hypothetical protein [Planctomycetaceae bacterium]